MSELELYNTSELTFKYLLTTAFLSGLPTSRKIWNQIENLMKELIENIGTDCVYDIINKHSFEHYLAIRYPRNPNYIQSVNNWFKNTWEKYNWLPNKFNYEPVDNNNSSPTDIGYKTYFLNFDHHYMTLLESFEGITRGTTGLSSWGASMTLFSWCNENSEAVLKNKRIIELGAGVGYTAAAILSLENLPTVYTATDYHPTVLSILLHNLSLIGDCGKNTDRQDLVEFICKMKCQMIEEELAPGEFRPWNEGSHFSYFGSEVNVEQLDWRRPVPVNMPPYDVILASDVVYARHLFGDLVRVIRELLTCQNNGYNKDSNGDGIKHKGSESSPKSTALGKISNTSGMGSKSIVPAHNNNLQAEDEEGIKTIMEDAEGLILEEFVKIQENTETIDIGTNAKPNETSEETENEILGLGFTFPSAFVACTKRDGETLSDFLDEIRRQGLRFKIVFRATLDRYEALSTMDESYKPVIIYQITL